jgi:hypothetical protein
MSQSNTLDSTANANNGAADTTTGSINSAVGVIGSAQYVTGGGHVTFPNSSTLSFVTNMATYSGWVNFNTLPGSGHEQVIMRKAQNRELGFGDEGSSSPYMRDMLKTDGGTTGWTASNDDLIPASPVTGQWYYVAFTYNGSVLQNFWNGVPLNAGHTVTANIEGDPYTTGIGAYNGNGDTGPVSLFMDAIIDEVRVEQVSRSSNWIWAAYMTVASNAGFSVYGSVQSGAITNFTINASAGANGSIAPSGSVSVGSGNNQTFTITANSGYGITNVVVDGSSVGVTNSYAFINVTAGHTISAFFGSTGTVSAGVDWPCYRGPNKDGSTTETIANWPPKELWRATIGQGYSEVVVSQGRAYTMGWLNGSNFVYCFSASSTGTNPAPLWKASYPGTGYFSSGFYGTACTPAVDGTNVYTFSTAGILNCFDTASGNTNWSVNIGTATEPTYGFCGSPLVEGNNVIVDAGGNGMAFNKLTGVSQWTSSGTAGFGSPYAITIGSQRTVVINSYAACFGVNPLTGSVLWNYPLQGGTPDDPGSIDPVIYSNQLWVAQTAGTASLVNLGSGTLSSVVWQTNSACGDNCSVFYNGYIYGPSCATYDSTNFTFDLGGGIQCVNFATGSTQWSANRAEFGEYSSVIRAGNQLVIMAAGDSTSGSNGNLVVANAVSTGYQEVYRTNGILTGDTWITPTLSNGKLYVRNNIETLNSPSTLICYDVSASVVSGTNNLPPLTWVQQYYPGATAGTITGILNSVAANGMTVAEDYFAGLNPTNASNSLILGITGSRTNIVITCPTVTATGAGYQGDAARYYELDTLTNLINGNWQPVPGYTSILGNNIPLSYTNTSPGVPQYFRVKALLLQ